MRSFQPLTFVKNRFNIDQCAQDRHRREERRRDGRLLRLSIMALALAWLGSPPLIAAETVKLTGGGASFPAPLYQRWFRDYYIANPGVQVDYQAIGSGAGIENFLGGRIDFAGSDLPLTEDEAAQVEGGIVQIPLAAGAVILAYNLEGIKGLKLSREAVTGIFLGEIQRWNDPLIQAANTDVDLPDMPVILITRSDSSGTTFVTTRHLSAISEQFAKTIGGTMTPVWPEIAKERGALIRGKGNGGVAAFIKAVPGSIGYIQYAYGHLTNLQMASLQNQAGKYVAPNSESFKAAVESFKAEIDPLSIADPRGAGSYPILTLSWLIARKKPEDIAKARALKDVVRYCLTEGQKAAQLLGYIPLTKQAVRQILSRLDSVE